MNPYIIPGMAKTIIDTTIPDIIKRVCVFYSVEQEKIFQTTRKGKIVTARHAVMWLLRKEKKMRLKDIAQMFHMDHTTVIHAVQSIDGRLGMDTDFNMGMKELMNSVKLGVVGYGTRGLEEIVYIPEVKKIVRPAAVYSNSSPLKIANG